MEVDDAQSNSSESGKSKKINWVPNRRRLFYFSQMFFLLLAIYDLKYKGINDLLKKIRNTAKWQKF